MTLPNVPYAGLTAPQMAFLDQTFAATAALGIVPCSASGTNIITLTPNANTPTISAYANYLQFAFVAVNSSTGVVTLQVGSLAPLNVYFIDGVTQVGSGSIVLGRQYVVMFNSALNLGGGGWVLIGGPNYQIGQIPGTATNDSANVGNIGEIILSSIVSGSGISLTPLSAATITSIPMTSGDWEISGTIGYSSGVLTTVVNEIRGTISKISNDSNVYIPGTAQQSSTIGQVTPAFFGFNGSGGVARVIQIPISPFRVSLSGNGATYFLSTFTNFSGVVSGYGYIQAIRTR